MEFGKAGVIRQDVIFSHESDEDSNSSDEYDDKMEVKLPMPIKAADVKNLVLRETHSMHNVLSSHLKIPTKGGRGNDTQIVKRFST